MWSIKKWFKMKPKKKDSFKVHRVEKVIHEQGSDSLECQVLSHGLSEYEKCAFIMEPTTCEQVLSLDGILFGQECFHDVDAGIFC